MIRQVYPATLFSEMNADLILVMEAWRATIDQPVVCPTNWAMECTIFEPWMAHIESDRLENLIFSKSQIEAGKVIEQGKHNELLKKSGGKYANLVQQQLAIEDKKEDTSTDPKADCLWSAKMEGVGIVAKKSGV